MARIAVITHEHDRFQSRRDVLLRQDSPYHAVRPSGGAEKAWPFGADSARAFVKDARRRYRGAACRCDGDTGGLCRVCARISVLPQSRRVRHLQASDQRRGPQRTATHWDGPVIVKSNLNNRGTPETAAQPAIQARGQGRAFSGACGHSHHYEVYASLAEVPPEMLRCVPTWSWRSSFPNRAPDGFAARFWVFCGDRERCTRYVSPQRLVKGDGHDPARACSRFPTNCAPAASSSASTTANSTFVMHEGRAVLLDANKTPGRRQEPRRRSFAAGAANLADGFEGLIRGRDRTRILIAHV